MKQMTNEREQEDDKVTKEEESDKAMEEVAQIMKQLFFSARKREYDEVADKVTKKMINEKGREGEKAMEEVAHLVKQTIDGMEREDDGTVNRQERQVDKLPTWRMKHSKQRTFMISRNRQWISRSNNEKVK